MPFLSHKSTPMNTFWRFDAVVWDWENRTAFYKVLFKQLQKVDFWGLPFQLNSSNQNIKSSNSSSK